MAKLYTLSLLLSVLLPVFPVYGATTQPQKTVWTVQEAVRFAHSHNPDARVAVQRIAEAQAGVLLSRAAFYPRLTVQADYARTNNAMYSFGNILNQGTFDNTIDFNNPGETDALVLKTDLYYTLYNSGDTAGLAMAEHGKEARALEHEAVLAALGFNVIQAFYTIVQAEETVLARQSSVDALSASLRVARARHDEGDLLKQEVLNLEVQQALARENLIQAEHSLNLAQRSFLHLLGLKGNQPVLDLAGSIQQKPPNPESPWKRAELEAMKSVIQSLEAGLRKARANSYPTASIYGSYQVDQGLEREENGASWFAGIRLDYTLFNGHRTAAAVEAAQSALAASREELHKLQLAVSLEQEQADLSLKQAEKRLQVTGKMVESALESARLSRARFKEGVILASDIIDTENRLTDARVRHALAMAAERIAIADLRRAYGANQFDNP